MDKILLVPDDKGEIHKILYGAVVDKFFFGLSAKESDRIGKPSINLQYPESESQRVLAIADYMTKYGILPRVHYIRIATGVYMVVIFKVENIERSFLEKWFLTSMLSDPISEKVDLIMTGEFETTNEWFRLFLSYYSELGYFYVYLIKLKEEGRSCNVFWESKLKKIQQGLFDLSNL